MATFIIVCLALVIAGIVFARVGLARYFAIRDHQNDVVMFGGAVRLLLWEPNEGLVILRYKRVSEIIQGGTGGTKFIYPIKGEELKARIPTTFRMLTWEDPAILTRESIQVRMKVAVWWRVGDLKKYVFSIDPDMHSAGVHKQVGILEAAEVWLKTLTESTLRTLASHSSVALLVSTKATSYLHVQPDDRGVRPNLAVESPDSLAADLSRELQLKTAEYGLGIQRVEIQEIGLSKEIQEAINKVWKASLLPAQSEQEVRARQIELQGAAAVLGIDTVRMNEVLKNFQGSTFLTFPAFLDSFMSQLSGGVKPRLPDTQAHKSLAGGEGE
jgi:regulator of protease activity HflC (stomatin/prohibitin superfamily)